ncbi:hypothetical protein Mucpa_3641 [Mucilaginibacter paludis DSM 18603]|uniref:Lipoprotein n=1 Tax=Mucilaginibacter paludis DSM 18603 TaxID=714943 RepID=H1XZP7_9SPHI|nr:hypothetical protein Mucpa_3641 [Mucilaginibacter paludis DSM 18603]
MKKIHYLGLLVTAVTLNSCFSIVGSVFRLGFRMGIYSVFIIIGLLIWVISKRGKRK